MKELKKRISGILQFVFGWGIYISLFVGGLSSIGYGVALIIGGDTAQVICHFIYKTLYPILVSSATITVLLGLLKMYLCGEVALSAKK